MKKTIKSACMYICTALLVCSFAGLNSCNPDEPEPPVAPVAPTGLATSDLTDISAVLAWEGEASIYEVSIDGAEPRAVTSKTFKATGLTPETDYSWQVRAKADGLFSEWVEGPVFRTIETVIEPTVPNKPNTPEVTDVTATSATFTWRGTATSFEIDLNGVSQVVDATTFTATELTPETPYEWEVRAINGDLQSDWVYGAAFITGVLLPGNIEFTNPFLFPYFEDYYGAGTSNFTVMLTTFSKEDSDKTGWLLSLDILSEQVDENNGSGYLDIPEGTYTFSSSIAKGNVILGDVETSTFLARVKANGDYEAYSAITGGTLTISGDHTGYSMTMDITFADGTTLESNYDGPIMIEAPKVELPPFGEIKLAEYYAMGSGIVNYAVMLTDDSRVDTGDGYMLSLDLYGSGSTPASVIPDGTYTLAGQGNMEIDPGYSYLTRYENKQPGGKIYLVSATLTTEKTGVDTYTMTVDAEAENGVVIQKTYSGVVTLTMDMTSASAKPQKESVRFSGKSFFKPFGTLSELRNL